ncbi:MAG: hypothetical protein LBH24_05060 [Clostridiales bacterium]|jgi:hypothetical protein|nr:hypothetical protein [Clostridiales bacterium]
MAENFKAAGRIGGNPLTGLCERVCIQTRRIFDGCMSQYANTAADLTLSNLEPPGLAAPFTYVGAVDTGPTVISNLTVTPAAGGDRSRVRFDATQGVTVSFTDANGASGSAESAMLFRRDVLLRLPTEALTPYQIEVATKIMSRIGSFEGSGIVGIRCCVVQLIRVVTTVELLVPSYGYCEYPYCQEFADSICPGFFETPIFPGD